MKTAVSVIVPCYNVAPYVDECMSGLAEQTLGPMEIICVDDGSTDGTLELLYRWREKDNRLRVISQSNAGVSAARNAGLDAAEGKYVGFVDPEDRETLLSGWKKWLELVGGEKALSRLDRWDQAFCRLLLDYPLQGNFFSSLRARLMSSRKGRRGAYYTLKRHLAR